jgi:hypothetical protein
MEISGPAAQGNSSEGECEGMRGTRFSTVLMLSLWVAAIAFRCNFDERLSYGSHFYLAV